LAPFIPFLFHGWCLETVIESSHCPKGEDRAENRVQERERERERENAIEKDREQEFGGNG